LQVESAKIAFKRRNLSCMRHKIRPPVNVASHLSDSLTRGGMTDAEAIVFYRGFMFVVILLDIAFATWAGLVWLGIVGL
jgi:hypothetical protein